MRLSAIARSVNAELRTCKFVARLRCYAIDGARQRNSRREHSERCWASAQKLCERSCKFLYQRILCLCSLNCILAQTEATKEELANRWLALPSEPRDKVKHDVLTTLSSPVQRAGSVAAQVVAAIAAVEIPHEQWPDVVGILLKFMDNADNTNLRIATLQSIGFICESIVSHSLHIPAIPTSNVVFRNPKSCLYVRMRS